LTALEHAAAILNIAIMNRFLRAGLVVLLGALIIEFGNLAGGISGGLIVMLGGAVMLYALVELLRRRF
jgi:hypothetical protein